MKWKMNGSVRHMDLFKLNWSPLFTPPRGAIVLVYQQFVGFSDETGFTFSCTVHMKLLSAAGGFYDGDGERERRGVRRDG